MEMRMHPQLAKYALYLVYITDHDSSLQNDSLLFIEKT